MISFLLDTLLATGALIALVLVLRKPVARAFGAQCAYALWLLPLLRFAMPPIWLPASFAGTPEAPVAAVPATAAATTIVMPATVPGTTTAAIASSASPSVPWLELVLAVWLGGALAFIAWRWISYRSMRRDLLAEARPVGEAGRIRLVETPAVSAPVAFGVIDKVVALPMFFMAIEDRAARDLAIAHELAHHRGRDLTANILAQPILALHWFNPLAWLAWLAMRRDQEAACDARVIAAQGRAERARYAQVIASFAAGPRLALAAPMACPMLGEKSIIHRLRSLTMDDISHRRRLLGRGLLMAGVLALPFTATVTYAASEQPEATHPTKTVSQHRMVIVDVDGGADPNDPDLHTRTLTRDGRTVVLKTDHPVSDAEAQDRVDRAFKNLARLDDLPVPPAPPAPPAPPVAPVAPVPPAPPAPPAQHVQFRGWSASDDSEYARKMEAWGQQMSRWSEEYGARYARQAEALAAQAQRNAPEVVESCDGNPTTVTRHEVTTDGRQRIVICERVATRQALGGLRSARETIARNRQMDPDVRDEVLNELDSEIQRIERDS
ncbi:MAG TPA: M56 family metallopeptidase [Croceibacterium sp.]|nr:M56 family metallopeptidase [Croceibacterium sp.]